MSEPIVTGELVVRNGRKRGTRLPLAMPVTVIGSAERCDVRLTAHGIGDVHCLVTATPAGPALRSWFPELTLLNGQPTAAAVLKDGDEIKVGPCIFQLCWHSFESHPVAMDGLSGDEFAALRAQAAAVVAQQAELVEQEWQLRDRAHDLHEQETQLAAVLEERYRRINELLGQLATGREQIRQERETQQTALDAQRAKLRRMRDRVRPLHRQALRDRQKARKLLARFLGHMKARWSAERRAVAADRAELDRCRREFDEQAIGFAIEQAKMRTDGAAYQKRLKDAWDLLNEGQRRLLADRTQAEKTTAERNALLDTRTRDVETRERALADGRVKAETRLRDLIAEGDRLEARVIRTREVLTELEAKRDTLEAGLAAGSSTATVVLPDVIHIDRRMDGATPERVLAELQARERELIRERQQFMVAKAELQRQADDLHDGRAVLAEQLASLTVVRDRLNADQRQALADLESVARTVHARELGVSARERSADDTDRRNRRRESELVQFRLRLDAWQSSLTAHEQTATIARDKIDAELIARRSHLERWEAALTTLCRKWAGVRKTERAALHDEVHRLASSRARYEAGLMQLDGKRDEVLAHAAKVAELQLAVEQVREELAAGKKALGRRATQRVRVLRRKWEAHFTRFRAELDARRVALSGETTHAGERVSAMHRMMVEAAYRRSELTVAEQASEAGRLTRERELDERAAVLSIEAGRAKRTEEALAVVRAEVERVAAAVMASGPDTLALPPAERFPQGVVPLRRAA